MAGEISEVKQVALPDGLQLGYRETGSGPTVLLLHGWPTSSFLWRRVMPHLEGTRPLALDLPGYGASDKPPAGPYGFDDFDRAIDGFLAMMQVDRVAIVGHDLGGPVATHWALGNRERLSAFGLLNTLVYPEFHPSVFQFLKALSEQETRDYLTSEEGLANVMKLGVADESAITDEVVEGVTAPFQSSDDRLALAKAGIGLSPEAFTEFARELPGLDVPARLIYGEQDKILPDIAETMARLEKDLPQAELTALPDCGHFLQEEVPDQVGNLLADFFESAL